jgi:mxaJ protein
MCSAFLRAASAVLLLLAPVEAISRELRVCADPNNLPFSNSREEGLENRLASLLAEELDATLTYAWWAQRRGFLRNTLNAGECDLVPGIPANLEGVRTTAPYYRSSFVFVTRRGDPVIASFDDPVLRSLKVGVNLVGDDGWNTPPAHALSRRGIVNNVRGYMIQGDYRDANPASHILSALAAGDIDVAVVWGPVGGYFAHREEMPLTLTPVEPMFDGPQLPMAFDISMATRKDDIAFAEEIDAALKRRRADVDRILAGYGVPRLDSPGAQAGALR